MRLPPLGIEEFNNDIKKKIRQLSRNIGIRKQIERVLIELETGSLYPRRFLENVFDNEFKVRLNDDYRLAFRVHNRESGMTAEITEVGKHDEFYRSLNNRQRQKSKAEQYKQRAGMD